MNLLILFGIRKNCHGSGRNLSLYLFIKRVKFNVVITEQYYSTYKILSNIPLLRLIPYVDGITWGHQCEF
jgi:hypothetical protein